MTNFRTALLAATVIALPLAAKAQPVTGVYVAAGAGVNFLMDQDQSASTGWFNLPAAWKGATSGTGRVNGSTTASARQPGFVGLGSIGWGFGNGLRAEVEGSWRNASLRSSSFSTRFVSDGTSFPIDGGGGLRGTSNQYAAMANLLFDMNIGLNWMYPYIGAGVGYSWQDFSGLNAGGGGTIVPNGRDAGMNYRSSSNVGSFAYQAIIGAAFPIAAVPGLSLTAEYRFMGNLSESLSVQGHGGGNLRGDGREGGGRNFGTANVAEAYNNSILLGVRYAFNAAPAAVMAAPAPVAPAAKSFLVFFDWDKSVLTDRARGIIKEAAQTSKSTQHTKIEVNGYADTSGSPKYNMGLSMRRAQTVAAELVRNGVGKQEIAIKAFGDTVLLVPTGPGVREPQNRRVEIIIR